MSNISSAFSQRYVYLSGDSEAPKFTANWMDVGKINRIFSKDEALPSTQTDGDFGWNSIWNVTKSRKNVVVFGILVEQDESYVADGIVVRTCSGA